MKVQTMGSNKNNNNKFMEKNHAKFKVTRVFLRRKSVPQLGHQFCS